LSLAITKKLQQKGVEFSPYSHVQYIDSSDLFLRNTTNNINSSSNGNGKAASNSGSNNSNGTTIATVDKPKPSKAVYVAHTFDSLSTLSFGSDVVAAFPSYAVREDDFVEGNGKASIVKHFAVSSGLEVGAGGGILVNKSLVRAHTPVHTQHTTRTHNKDNSHNSFPAITTNTTTTTKIVCCC